MHILMLVMSDVLSDPRVRIEAETLIDAGHAVTAIGHQPPPVGTAQVPGLTVHWTMPDTTGSRLAHPMMGRADSGDDRRADDDTGPAEATAPTKSGLHQVQQAVLAAAKWLLLPAHRTRVQRRFARRALTIVRSLAGPFDVVHAHDFTGLVPGATFARECGAALVYDAHECWTGRRLAGRPAPLLDRSQRRTERILGTQADVVLTVSEGIADWLRDHHGWDDVIVVHNSFRPAPSLPDLTEYPSGIVFAGRVDSTRDVDTAASALASHNDIRLHVYASRLVDVTLPSTTVVHAPISEEALDAAYRRHGLGLVSLSGGMVNHDLALPNKLFHAVRAGVPVVAADLPELRRMVVTYDLGAIYQPGDTASFRQALDGVIANWDHHVSAVAAAGQTLNWDQDGAALLAVYRRLSQLRPSSTSSPAAPGTG